MKRFLKFRYMIIVLAVILPRIAWFILLGGDLPRPVRDQGLYLSMAGRISAGEGLSFSRETGILRSSMAREEEIRNSWGRDPEYLFGLIPVETPTASIEPGYPIILAALFILTGPSMGAVFFLNTLFALLGAWAVWKLVQENWGEKQALVAAFIWSVYPYFVYYSAYAMTDMIHISLIPMILLLTLRASSSVRSGFFSGVASGFLFLVRSTAVFLVPLQMAWLIFRKKWRSALLLSAGFILCCIPWVVRNQIELGTPVLLPTKGSINLWMRNNPSFLAIEGITILGYIEDRINREELLEFPPMDSIETEIARSNVITQRAKQFILSNPLLFSYLSVVRFGLFLSPIGGTMENPAVNLAGILIYLPMLIIAVLETVKRRKNGRVVLIASIFILYLVLHSLVHGGVRYRLPVDTVLIIMTALFIGRKAGWAESEKEIVPIPPGEKVQA